MLLHNGRVDPEMRKSQNRFGFYGFYELSLHKKTNIIRKENEKKLKIVDYFYHRAVVKQDHYMTQLLSYSSTVL